MEHKKRYLTAVSVLQAAAIWNFAIALYNIHQHDWFTIGTSLIPPVLIVVAVTFMHRD